MSAHEIVTLGEPKKPSALTGKLLGTADELWVSVTVECSECGYAIYSGATQSRAAAMGPWIPDHIAQHAPGRALDIEVVWEPSACCSVCEDGIGDVREESSEVLECRDCGTTWNYDGTMGELSG
jgi:ribosomal protein L37AE/L43A